MTDQKHTTWKTIRGFPCYQISELGEVRSNRFWRSRDDRIMSQHFNSHGYLRVRLTGDRGRKSLLVHKIIAEMFLPPKPGAEYEIRHLNGNRSDNSFNN